MLASIELKYLWEKSHSADGCYFQCFAILSSSISACWRNLCGTRTRRDKGGISSPHSVVIHAFMLIMHNKHFDWIISFLKFNSDSKHMRWICVCLYSVNTVCVCVCVCVNGYRGKEVLVSLGLNRLTLPPTGCREYLLGPF